ncbi:MAG: methyl-accepting chemotaxis protein [Selenomonadaceae bacterium]|nr:methyl-accepting chemotaxis protein [Selenomonadaceae bacterium]
MKLRQKFMMLSFVMAAVIVAICGMSYYFASSELSESVDSELRTTVEKESTEINGWLETKQAYAICTANALTAYNGNPIIKTREALATTINDKEILDMAVGFEDKYFLSYNGGNYTGKIDPAVRPWYKGARDTNTSIFTAPYVDLTTKGLIVSVGTPIRANGKFIGANCLNIALNVLAKRANEMKYHNEGFGIITEANGNILATAKYGEPNRSLRDVDGFSQYFDQMVSSGKGFFEVTVNGEDMVFAYSTVKATGWIVGIAVPADFVFASLNSLKITFAILIIIACVLIVGICLVFAGKITEPVSKLADLSLQMSKGNLTVPDAHVDSEDEIGVLTQDFNVMKNNLQNLISKMSLNAHQVASSSQELNASSQQSAEAAVHVAETVNEVSDSVERQMADITSAKTNIDSVFKDIQDVEEKSRIIAETSNQTSQAAQKGSELMGTAVDSMSRIETSVMASADVVKKLGENSRQIGQIVDAISAISEQTNLLALNAAIEAARAGEHGKGFAVVAEEVRKLAAESQDSAEQIKVRIDSIQSATEEAVNAMDSGTNEVKEGTGAIREVGNQFGEILSMVNNIKTQMNEINHSVQTVSKETANVVAMVDSIDEISKRTAENMKKISSVTEQQSASNEQIAASSQSLSQMAEDMQDVVSKFNVGH